MPERSSLEPLFAPRSIAFVGISRTPSSLGRRAMRHVLQHGFAGDVHLVHPQAAEIDGIAAVRSIAEIEPLPDLVFICTDGDRVVQVIEEAVDAGVPAIAAIAASGSVIHAKDEIRALLERSGARLLGPNSPGYLSVNPSVAPHISNFVSRAELPSAPIGLISHSGAVGGILGDHLVDYGVGLDWLICTGNEFDVGMGECLQFLAQRDLRAIGLFVEAVRDRAAFQRGLQLAAERNLAVLAVKVGRSAAGVRQAMTHTGALAGDSALFERALIDAGGVLCDDLEDLAARLAIATLPRPRVRSVAVGAASGGLAGALGDLAVRSGVAVPDLIDLPNPWDTDVQIVEDPPAAALRWRAMLSRDEIGAGMLGFGSLPDATWAEIIEAFLADPVDKPVVFVPAAGMPSAGLQRLRGRVITVQDGSTAANALAWSMRGADAPPATNASAASHTGRVSIDELAGKQLLRDAGVHVPEGAAVESVAEAISFAARADGPFVLKCLRPELTHKAAAGGVRLGLTGGSDELTEAWTQMAAAVERSTGTPMRAALLEQMVAPGLELIVSVSHDVDYGPYLTIGAGGAEVEHDADVAHRLLPADDVCIEDALAGLRIGGATRQAAVARGESGPAPRALVALVGAVTRLAAAHPGWSIEINPVIVPFSAAPVAVDCVITGDPAN